MLNYQHILVVIEPEDTQLKALHRAFEIEAKSQANLTIFTSIYNLRDHFFFASEGKRQQKLISEKQQWLAEHLEALDRPELIEQVKVCWQRTPTQAIADILLADEYDLVIKACSPKRSPQHLWLSHVDWHLITQCNTPVLLVKDHPWQKYGHIISSLDIVNHDNGNGQLNRKLFKQGEEFAESFNATHHIFDCYFEDDYSMALADHDFYHHSQRTVVKNQHLKAVNDFLCENRKQAIGNPEDIHVIRGLPEDELPHTAAQLDAELVIMGTHNTQGIMPYFVGHTCDHVLDKVPCDLLVLKPS